jgi:hypothetical protein
LLIEDTSHPTYVLARCVQDSGFVRLPDDEKRRVYQVLVRQSGRLPDDEKKRMFCELERGVEAGDVSDFLHRYSVVVDQRKLTTQQPKGKRGHH